MPALSRESTSVRSQVTVVAALPSALYLPVCLVSIRPPLCQWKCLSLGNDFSRVDKSQHGDLQLGEQPFGYAEHCLH